MKVVLLSLFIICPYVSGMKTIDETDIEKGTRQAGNIAYYTLKKLKKHVSSGNGDVKKLLNRIKKREKMAASADVFKDYLQKRPYFSLIDEPYVTQLVDNIAKQEPETFYDVSRGMIKDWLQHNTPPNSGLSDASLANTDKLKQRRIEEQSMLDQFLLQRLKGEQLLQLQEVQQNHEAEMQQRRYAQKKFYVTTTIAAITSILSIVEGVFLALKS